MIARVPPPYVTIVPTGTKPGYLTTDRLLVLQRHGASETLEACVALGGVTVRPTQGDTKGSWTVTARQATGTTSLLAPHLDSACRAAAELAGRFIGFAVGPAPFIAAATFGSRSRVVRDRDRIVSPLRYEPATETVRIVASNVAVAAFDNGSFARVRVFDSDVAGTVACPFVEQALATGFGRGHRGRGSDYCKRRLAWLAGVAWLDASKEPLVSGVLKLDMTLAEQR